MNNFLRIMALPEEMMLRTVFVTPQEEAGINSVYDPETNAFTYQVFIHIRFPYRHLESWEFANFEQARSFAARKFTDWEYLSWEKTQQRPCEKDGRECGTGSCESCKKMREEDPELAASGGGGCGKAGGCGCA